MCLIEVETERSSHTTEEIVRMRNHLEQAGNFGRFKTKSANLRGLADFWKTKKGNAMVTRGQELDGSRTLE
jgi:hypothetical protein